MVEWLSGKQRNAMTAKEESEATEQILAEIERIDSLIERHAKEVSKRPHSRSESAADDKAMYPLDMGSQLQGFLGYINDHLQALLKLVRRPDGNYEFLQLAHWPHIRALIENACMILWVLTPDDARERE